MKKIEVKGYLTVASYEADEKGIRKVELEESISNESVFDTLEVYVTDTEEEKNNFHGIFEILLGTKKEIRRYVKDTMETLYFEEVEAILSEILKEGVRDNDTLSLFYSIPCKDEMNVEIDRETLSIITEAIEKTYEIERGSLVMLKLAEEE